MIAHSSSANQFKQSATTYRWANVEGVRIFYREAGSSTAPTIVMFHGFPSSSRSFDRLIPLLAPLYHVVAPDYPAFGHSDQPEPKEYSYTFDKLADTMDKFLDVLRISKCVFLLHDYGGPVGFRLMLKDPARVAGLIVMNANAYAEGLGKKWAGIADFWSDRSAHADVFDNFISQAATELRHTLGTSHLERYNPDTWTDEYQWLAKPGQYEIQAELLFDYQTNVKSYETWQHWLRQQRPATLVVWGRNDPSFVAAGAVAYKRDLPEAEVHLLDGGHFPLDEQNDEIASLIKDFMARHSN